ncbi:MAG: hypothetical protein ACK55I_18925, partial [bacterium]
YIYMEKHSIFFYIFIIFVLFLCLRIYYDSDAFNLKCIIASKDGNRYCVREREKLELAANLLASVTAKCKELVEYMKQKTDCKFEGAIGMELSVRPSDPGIDYEDTSKFAEPM